MSYTHQFHLNTRSRSPDHAYSRSPDNSGSADLSGIPADFWARIQTRLRIQLGDAIFTSWFAGMQLHGVNGGTAHMSVATSFLKSWIQSHYAEQLLTCWKSEHPAVTRVQISPRSAALQNPRASAAPFKPAPDAANIPAGAPSTAPAAPDADPAPVPQPAVTESSDSAEQDAPKPANPKPVRVAEIQRVIALRYSLSRDELLSPRRTNKVVRPRQIGMYLAKTLTTRSLPDIARRFGKRDHTTVLHAIRKIGFLIQTDNAFAAEIELLRTHILQ